ncbi:metal-dependent hydrolase [Cytophaga sp. FL35]|uniref:metal-dependent hydrolase n=1 Tax=Cytophaga sp. FL35 TaxID=1904456 RepID=UPI001653D50F|nr:metal-dependent hydrolase [Cytophaga sp. FL35]MBC6998309.1 metal-dependent hydrolase [Cytophaga sp. FL35]
MKITHYGQNTLAIEIGETHIIVDPFITENELSKDKIDINSLKADFIFLTHAHFDHTLDAEAIAKNTGATIVSNFEIYSHYASKDLNAMPMNHGGIRTFDFGEVKYVNAIHTSSFPDGSYGGNPGGFVITANGKSIYISGDTALTVDMKLIPLYKKIDLAILPIGDVVTMGIDDAIHASNFVECDRVLGVHYDVFPFTKVDKASAKDTFSKAQKELILLDVGESISI